MRWIADNTFDERYQFWTRANVSEVIPDPPTPLSWHLVWEGAAISGWYDLFTKRCGMGVDELDETRCEAIGIFGGYAYLGASLFRIWAGRTPGLTPSAIDEAYFGDHPDVPPYVEEPWHARESTTEVMGGYMAWATGDMNQDELEADRLLSLEIQASRPRSADQSDRQLLDHARSLRPILRRMFDQHINQSIAASVGPGALGAVTAAVGRPTDAMRLMVGFGTVDSALPSYAMWELSRSVRASASLTALFDVGPIGLYERLQRVAAAEDNEAAALVGRVDAFLREYGSRGANEWDISASTWEVNPDAALALVDRMRLAADDASPRRENAARESERLAVAAEIRAMLAGDDDAMGAFEMGLRNAATFLPGRERSKTSIIRVVNEVRMAIREIARRAVARGALSSIDDVFLLFPDELEVLVDGGPLDVSAIVRPRAEHRRYLMTLEPPFIINGQAPPVDTWPKRDGRLADTLSVGDVLQGGFGCPGKATGRARVVLDPLDPRALEPGDILVAPFTDPSWTPLFVTAAAVVVDTGAPSATP
jgi:pyruvate,water dikinase